MKNLMILLALALSFSACSSNKADEKNADTMMKFTDTTANKDTTAIMADSSTNAPADVKN